MIAIIDYKMGNTGSIKNMLKKIGASAVITLNPEDIEKASKVILPGIGSFDKGISNIRELGLLPILNEKALKQKIPFLGICLGMQLFTRKSEEGVLPGLGWIEGETVRFRFAQNGLKIPHMGWNSVEVIHGDSLFRDMDEARFYFVHSYHVVCDHKRDVLSETHYGYDFTSSIRRENIYGTQFHPEKSHKYGLMLLKNFVELA